MTFLEKAKNDLKVEEFSGDGLPCKCPCKYGYEKEYSYSGVECEECWNREMPNTEPQVAITKDDLELEYSKGLNDAWELAKKVMIRHGDYSGALSYIEMQDIYDTRDFMDIMNLSPQEALAKMKAYEEEQKKVEIGDIVDWLGVKAVVLDKIDEERIYLFDENGCVEEVQIYNCEKLGKRIDIDDILECIRKIGE